MWQNFLEPMCTALELREKYVHTQDIVLVFLKQIMCTFCLLHANVRVDNQLDMNKRGGTQQNQVADKPD